MNCKVCNSKSKPLFKGTVLNKYSIQYYKCSECQFIQTEEPFWLNEAYSDSIALSDVGLVMRNLKLSIISNSILKSCFDYKDNFLDYGAGYGLFVRIMRDKGFKFYWQDNYTKNLFAKNFEFDKPSSPKKYACVTSFEVFEHLMDPLSEIDKMLKFGESILFSTETHDGNEISGIDKWRYFTPDTGQHISLYSLKSLKIIARKHGLNLYSNNKNLHLLTSKKFMFNPIKFYTYFHYAGFKFLKKYNYNPKSLINKDYKISIKSC